MNLYEMSLNKSCWRRSVSPLVSVLNMHELVETVPGSQILNFPHWHESNEHFPRSLDPARFNALIKFLTRCYLPANSRGPAMIPCMTCIYRECKAKYRMEWSYGKPYMNTCLHVVYFLETIFFCQWNKCFISLNMSPLCDFFERVKILWVTS